MRARSNNFAIDGSDNNDPDVGVRRQGFLALVPQSIESVNELSISTLLWDAELGRNLSIKSMSYSKYGEDGYHGQAYAFFNDSRLNARNAFDLKGGVSGGKDPFTRTQAGLVIGGPIASSPNAVLRKPLSTAACQGFYRARTLLRPPGRPSAASWDCRGMS